MGRALIEIALLAYPRDFRGLYRSQILNDFEEGHAGPAGAALDLFCGGLTMRTEIFTRNVSYALRRLRKMPLFSAIVAMTFALGIGANVAVFSILNAVLLRPLPYPNVSSLVVYRMQSARQPAAQGFFSIPELNDLAAESTTVDNVAASAPDGPALEQPGAPPRALFMDAVTPKYFDALGIRPQLGRFFSQLDERPGTSSVVLSDALWRSTFDADPNIVGRVIRMSGRAFTVIGVAPRGLKAPDLQEGLLGSADGWEVLPDRAPPGMRGARYIGIMGTLRPGVSIDAANAELAVISKRLQQRYPRFEGGTRYFVEPLSRSVFGGISSALWTLFAAVLCILIVTCANVASMLIASASTRDHEFGVRASLGASRRNLAEQLLIETGALALIGGAIGVSIAYASLSTLRSIFASVPRIGDATIDLTALLYAAGIVLLCTVISGLWPIAALPFTRLAGTMKTSARGGRGATGNRLRAGLIIAEVAVSLALVIVSGLVVRSFYMLVHSDVGVRPQGVAVSTLLGLPNARYTNLDQRAAFERRFLNALTASPGIDDAALAVSYPLSYMRLQMAVAIEGRTFLPNQEPNALSNTVTPGYFRTLGISIVRGRDFSERDTASSQPVVIVNKAFARMYIKNGDALGMRLVTPGWNGTARAVRTIVGIAADTRMSLQDAAGPQIYVPLQQGPPNLVSVIVRSPLSLAQKTGLVQKALAVADPTLPPLSMQTYGDLIVAQSQEARSMATLLAVLALLALVLALSGIFGVVSYNVTQRYGEFGVRIALGARSTGVLTDVLLRALQVTMVGVVIGIVLGAFGARAVRSQLYGVAPFDAATFAGVITMIVVCAVAASIVPAWRAMRVNPATTLRYE